MTGQHTQTAVSAGSARSAGGRPAFGRPSRRSALAGITATLAIALAACGMQSEDGAEAEDQGPLRIGIGTPVQTLDLPRYQGHPDLMVGTLVLDTLVTYDDDLEVIPHLAESWEQPDPLTYVFTLREGVVFHDGTELTGESVVAQFEHALTIEQLDAWTGPIESITSDGLEVTFTLNHTSPSFLPNMAGGPFAIQSDETRDLAPDELARNPVGTGPYVLDDWTGDVITLVRNDDYWGEAPQQAVIEITSVADSTTRFNGLEAGEFDVIQGVAPYTFTSIQDGGDIVGLSERYAQTIWLLTTHSNPILSDPLVREAIAYAIDVDDIVETVTEGLTRPATGFIPPELQDSDAQARERDLDEARSLLEAAGYPDGLTIPLYTTNGRYLGDADIAQAIQSQLAEADITAEITVFEYAGLAEEFGKPETGLAVTGWSHRATPDAMLAASLSSAGGFNFTVYENAEFDALLDEAAVQPTLEEAQRLWAEADALAVEDVAGVPIYWSNSLYAHRSDISGFGVNPLGYMEVLDVTRG